MRMAVDLERRSAGTGHTTRREEMAPQREKEEMTAQRGEDDVSPLVSKEEMAPWRGKMASLVGEKNGAHDTTGVCGPQDRNGAN